MARSNVNRQVTMTSCLRVIVALTLCHACRADIAACHTANWAFGHALAKELGKSTSKNVLVSPYSLTLALSNVYYGARNGTRTQLAKTMFLYDIPGNINDRLHAFSSSIFNSSMPYTLRMANGLFARQGLPFLEDFVNFTAKYYDTHLKILDFNRDSGGSRSYINDWAAKDIDGNVTDLIDDDELNASPVLVMVSAIYFNGNKWLMPFDRKRTIVKPFFVSFFHVVLTRMMTLRYRPFNYNECSRFFWARVIELPFDDNKASMFVFLPNIGKGGLPNFLHRMDKYRIDSCITTMYSVDIDVYLPRFRVSEKMRLKGVLTSLGTKAVFDDKKADLSGVSGGPGLVMSEVFHHAVIDINEGTPERAPYYIVDEQAAAASIVFPFKADHPFVFLIRDKATGIFLFVGAFNSPEEEEGLVMSTDPPTTGAPIPEPSTTPTTTAKSSVSDRKYGTLSVRLVGLVTAYQLVVRSRHAH